MGQIKGLTQEEISGVIAAAKKVLKQTGTLKEKFLVKNAIIPAGTVGAANGLSFEFDIDSSKNYDKIKGVVIYENQKDSGLNYQVQIRNNSGTIVEYVSSKHLTANENTPMNQRLFALDTPAGGEKIYIDLKIYNTTPLTLPLDLSIVFKEEMIKQ